MEKTVARVPVLLWKPKQALVVMVELAGMGKPGGVAWQSGGPEGLGDVQVQDSPDVLRGGRKVVGV